MFDFIDPAFSFTVTTHPINGKRFLVEIYRGVNYDYIREISIR